MSSFDWKPSSFSISSSTGRPWQSQPPLRGTKWPRIVLKRGNTSLNTRLRTWCDAGAPVGGGRALVEHERRAALAPAHRLVEHVALAPAREHLLLELGERLRRVDRLVAGQGVDSRWDLLRVPAQ